MTRRRRCRCCVGLPLSLSLSLPLPLLLLLLLLLSLSLSAHHPVVSCLAPRPGSDSDGHDCCPLPSPLVPGLAARASLSRDEPLPVIKGPLGADGRWNRKQKAGEEKLLLVARAVWPITSDSDLVLGRSRSTRGESRWVPGAPCPGPAVVSQCRLAFSHKSPMTIAEKCLGGKVVQRYPTQADISI